MKTVLGLLFSVISVSGYSQDSLLIKEVFDFNIGDVFKYQTTYQGGCMGTKTEWDTLIDKSYSANLDTVYYTFHEYISNNVDNWDACTPGIFTSNRNRIDKYFSLDSLLWRYDNYIRNTTMPPNLISGTDSCGAQLRGYYIPVNPGVESLSKVYGKGIGLVKYTDDWTHGYTHTYLVYYHKNNLICSNGQITNVPQFSIIKAEVNIYPNPAIDNFNIKLSKTSSGYSIKIFDITGRNVFNEGNINAKLFNCNIQHLNSGIYNLIIQTKEGDTYHKKLIKK